MPQTCWDTMERSLVEDTSLYARQRSLRNARLVDFKPMSGDFVGKWE